MTFSPSNPLLSHLTHSCGGWCEAAELINAINGAGIATPVSIANGGTGQTTAVAGKDALTVQGASIASATTTDLSTATGELVTITGTTTINSFGTTSAGAERVLYFASATLIIVNSAAILLPGGLNIATRAGDIGTFRSLGSGNWICIAYVRGNVGDFNTPANNQAPAIGYNNTTSGGTHSSAFGYNNTATSNTAVAFGANNTASTSAGAVALGITNTASGAYGSAIGYSNSVTSTNGSSVGYNNKTAAGVSLGYSNNGGGGSAILIGSTNSGSIGTAIGSSCSVTSGGSVAIGAVCSASNSKAVAVGQGCTASGYYAAAVGWGCTVSGYYNCSLGYNNNNSTNSCTEVGYGSTKIRVSSAGILPVGAFWLSSDGSAGLTSTITTAKLTGGGANGTMVFKNGLLTSSTPAT